MKPFEAEDVRGILFELSTDEANLVADGLAKRAKEERARKGAVNSSLASNLSLQADRYAARARTAEPIVVGGRDLAIVHLGFTAIPDETTRDAVDMLEEALLQQAATDGDQTAEPI